MSQPNSSSPASPPTLPPNPRDARRPLGVPIRPGLTLVTALLIVASVVASVPYLLGRPLPMTLFISQQHRAPLTMTPNTADDGSVPDAPATTLGQRTGAFLPEVLRGGQAWRLFTPMFLHFSWAHLLFNMFGLYELGGILERRYGAGRFLLLVAGLALVSNVAQYVGAGPAFGGMSGVIFGLFGYVWVQGRLNPAGFGYVLAPQAIVATMIWFALCFTGFFPIANYAHAGGLLAGAAASWVVARQAMREVWARRRKFQGALGDADDEPLHRCRVCGRTERDADGTLEFRVSSVDGEEYCTEHLPARR